MTQAAENRLAQEKSPYLLQHKNNPVNWFPWSEEAFAEARSRQKPVFLSIGYSTCYWCHVMERDSFERDEVAEVLNEHFVSIKVDREERPDIDQIYMDAVVAMTGRGGWPMSVFLTPDKKPFYGGTFFPKEQFVSLLLRIAEVWASDRDNIFRSAGQLTEAVSAQMADGEGGLDEQSLVAAFKQFRASFDSAHGGFGPAPKFPRAESLALLLRLYRRSGSAEALEMVRKTLHEMARGGIYDHLDGGFSRYSTDAAWLVPHFEKMLYDNALLAALYLDASTATGELEFAAVARETLDYTLRRMTSPQGPFYSAEDAGEVGEEGAFYVWSYQELRQILSPDELSALEEVFELPREGNFEHGKIVLSRKKGSAWSAKNTGIASTAIEKLNAARGLRPRPHLDDKVLTSWNALMIRAMAKGYQVLGEERLLSAATKAARFIERELWKDERLLRRFRDGSAMFPGYLEDYAFLIAALIELYESDFDSRWLDWAQKLQELQDRLFWDDDQHGYFYTSVESSDVLFRKKDFTDGAVPSGNSVAAMNLLKLSDLFGERRYYDRAEQTLRAMAPTVERVPQAFGEALQALNYMLDGSKQIVVLGPGGPDGKAEQFFKSLRRRFIPNKILGFGSPPAESDDTALPLFHGKALIEGSTTFYICQNQTCREPTGDSAAALSAAESFTPLELG